MELTDKHKKYLATFKFLIIEQGPSLKATIRQVLCDHGVPLSNVTIVENFNDAVTSIGEIKQNIVISRLDIDGVPCDEVINKHLEECPNRLRNLFFITTEKNSPALASAMSEKEIDGVIFKPLNGKVLMEGVLVPLLKKAKPSEDLKNLEQGRENYFSKEYNEAKKYLELPEESSIKSRALWYKALIQIEENDLKGASASLEESIDLNPENIRSLYSIFEVHMKNKSFQNAYIAARSILEIAPINPSRIPDFVKISVATQNFKDVSKYSQIFESMDIEDSFLKKNISVGLYISGKFLATKEGKSDEAFKTLEKASKLSNYDPKILAGIIDLFIGLGKTQEADKLLGKIPEKERNADVNILELRLNSVMLSAPQTLNQAMQMIQKGIKNDYVYEIAIDKSKECGRNSAAIEDLVDLAIRDFPNKKDHYYKMRA